MKQVNITILKAELKDLQEALNEQLEEIIELEGKIPQIEFDILRENLRKIYEGLNLLYRLNDPVEKKIAETPPVVHHIERTSPEYNDPTPIAEFADAPLLVTLDDEPAPEMEDLVEEPSVSYEPINRSLIDLKSLININDKFLFINELFDGNLRIYTQCVDQLNEVNDKGEAFAMLENMGKQNLLDANSPAFKKFRDLLEKRFA